MEIPKSNMYDKNIKYSFTLNPDDSHQFMDDRDRIDKLVRYWGKQLEKYSWEYNLYAEFSTPKNSKSFPRFHFHGIISFATRGQVRNWYKATYRQLSKISYFDIDTISDIDHWRKYCQKNQEIMKKIMNKSHFTSVNYPEMIELSE